MGKHLVVETVTCTVSPFLTGSIAVDGVDAGYTLPVTILPSDPAPIPDTDGTYIRFDTAWDDNAATNLGL